MDRNGDANPGKAIETVDSPEARWTAWGIWSGLSLGFVLLAVLGAGFDTSLLLGWIVGIIVAAMLMVFRRKGPVEPGVDGGVKWPKARD